MDSKFIRGHRAQINPWYNDWEIPFSKEEFNKIILPFCVKKEKAKNDNEQLIYISSARMNHHQILKNKGNIEYEI